ncbi:MAG: methionyl-tRNA formyltransferase [Treponemataceae bacterium]|nr:methionyl-tRNA formyltransferase [Treponemataceae bacterium]
MRILYAGSPDCAAELLKELHKLLEGSGNEIVAVLTNPPTAKGRHHDLTPTPTGLVAQELKLPLLTPEKLDSSAREAVEAFAPDLLVCFAYGRIFGPKFMGLFPKGGINFHPSLLPFYRGCAPVPAAIWNMEKETGFTVQRIAQKMDSGDILLQKKYTMTGTENADSLLHTAAKEGAPMLRDVILSIQKGCDKGIVQDDDKATYSKMLTKEDGEIDWNKSAAEIDATIRACTPWPGAYTTIKGNVLKIIEASVYNGTTADFCPDVNTSQAAPYSARTEASGRKTPCPGKVIGVDKKEGILFQTGKGLLVAKTLQWQAKKAMAFKDFLNGCRDFTDCVCEPKKSTSC